MISWIVATHNTDTLHSNLLASLGFVELIESGTDELVVVQDAPSIAVAYNEGQAKASHGIRCYVHHDVQILDLEPLRAGIAAHCPDRGIVGLVGSITPVVPWWDGVHIGSVIDSRHGQLGPGGHGEAAYLDGLLLATAHDLTWDETYTGWHLYDHDMCRQQLDAGRTNWCLDGGVRLVRHNTTAGRLTWELDGWDAGVARFNEKYRGTLAA